MESDLKDLSYLYMDENIFQIMSWGLLALLITYQKKKLWPWQILLLKALGRV